ncbi:MAG: hypothetical protein HY744_28995 [Deltaproteobacteria bacterium]|nr:hypothetical protein [Deltaproteobacteria bacterium]
MRTAALAPLGFALCLLGCSADPAGEAELGIAGPPPAWAVGTFHLAPEHGAPGWDTNLTVLADGRLYFTAHSCAFSARYDFLPHYGALLGTGRADSLTDGSVAAHGGDAADAAAFRWPVKSEQGCNLFAQDEPAMCGADVPNVALEQASPDIYALGQGGSPQQWLPGEKCTKCAGAEPSAEACSAPADFLHARLNPYAERPDEGVGSF